MPVRSDFRIGAHNIRPGSRATIDLPVSVLSDHTPVSMPVHVVHGRRPGPTLFVSAAIHGDEIIGVEIVRRLLKSSKLRSLKGTLLAAPIVNAFGFVNRSRYLPDRRDLNRSFPGSSKGSLAARLAHLFVNEIAKRSDVGIDLHSAAIHRTNLPQVRISEGKPRSLDLARAFGAPVILMANTRAGSLRNAVEQMGIDVLVYEAGEGLRFDERSVRAGLFGILRVMRQLGMLSAKGISRAKAPPIISSASAWTRSPSGGLLRTYRTTGDEVRPGELLGVVSDPFGEIETEVISEYGGLLIGRTNLPIVNEGDGLFHVAQVDRDKDAANTIEGFAAQLEGDPLFDDDAAII